MSGAAGSPAAFQDRYPEKFSHCYGCGRSNPHGHHLKSLWDGAETVACLAAGREVLAHERAQPPSGGATSMRSSPRSNSTSGSEPDTLLDQGVKPVNRLLKFEFEVGN